MKIEEILQIIWYWSQSQPAKYTSEQVKVQKKTVLRWYKRLRDICTAQMLTSTKMGGPGFELQIEESLFQGKRKYHRGRMLQGDKKPKEPSELDNAPAKTKRNYGNRVQGPWVFGIVCQKSSDIKFKKQLKQTKEQLARDIIKQYTKI